MVLSIIKLKGGLGNQMFQYAFYLAMKRKHPLTCYLFDNGESRFCHNGIALDDAFEIETAKKGKWCRRVNRHLPAIVRNACRVEQENALQYDAKYLDSNRPTAVFDGYWQSEKYFSPVAEVVRRAFRFREEKISDKNKEMAEAFHGLETVSVHIRRGDYLQLTEYHGLCTESYYHDAMDFMRIHHPNATFVFFSDDIPWVKENIMEDSAVYVDWNVEKDSWQDMYLMSQCKHNIIANSSFSWWGAWLNGNPNKSVVAPKQWFKVSPNYDILPSEWITL